MEIEDLGLLNSPSRDDVSVGSAAKVQSPMMPDLSKDLHHNGEYCRSVSSVRTIPSYCDVLSDASRKFESQRWGQIFHYGFRSSVVVEPVGSRPRSCMPRIRSKLSSAPFFPGLLPCRLIAYLLMYGPSSISIRLISNSSSHLKHI